MKNKHNVLSAFISAGILFLQSAAVWAQAAAPAPAKNGGLMEQLGFVPMLLMIVAVFYLLVFRPQQKQAKERKALLSTIKKGDQVVTVGGIHGRITGVTDAVLTLEIADNCRIKVDRACVQSVSASKEKENGTS